MKHYIYILMCAAAVLSACSEDLSLSPAGNVYGTGEEINLTAGYQTLSRVTDVGFTDGDRMGIYILDYQNDEPQSLASGKRHADNVLYTYSESENKWTGATKLYWNDKTTPVDIYGYYPFDAAMATPTAYAFSVKTNQNTSATAAAKGGYEASDLLRAKAERVAPTSDVIQLTYNHVLAGVTIRLQEGEGFATGEWAEARKMVWIGEMLTEAIVNLETAAATVADGSAVGRITPLEYNGDYRAVVVPQTVATGREIIGLTINGDNYSLKKDALMTFTSGKMHTFTIKVDKKANTGEYVFSLVDEAVSKWIDDEEFHDGIVREYVCVHVETPGTLEQVLTEMGLDPSTVESMKLTGSIDAQDRELIGRRMKDLTSLNARDVFNVDDNFEFPDEGHIIHVVYPATGFKYLGSIGCLIGKQIIPEGVEEINWWSVSNGEVEFPSTLKKIGNIGGQFRGEIHLPEGLEEYGSLSGDYSGPLYLPSTLKKIGTISGKFTGDLVIPQGVKEIPNFAFQYCTFTGSLVLPEGLEKIGGQAFNDCTFKGELKLPSTLARIEHGMAFRNIPFTKIILNDNIKFLGSRTFEGCNRLTGTVSVPKNICSIPDQLYKDCSMITGIELHKDVSYIGSEAFKNCHFVQTIRCDAEEPPVFEENTFEGLSLGDVVVEVPAASVPLYQQDDRWKRFKRITAYSSFVCRPQTACALNARHTEPIVLNADGAWTVTHQPEWVELSATNGKGKTAINVTFKNMANGSGNREDYIEFKLDNKSFTTRCTVSQYDYEYDEDAIIALQEHKEGNGIKLLFLGDGWDGKEISEGRMMEQFREDMEYFFAIPPYDRLRDYFDVYAAVSLSQESGVNTPNTYLNTRFGTIYGGAGMNMIPDQDLIFPYAKELGFSDEELWRGLIVLVPNTTDYSGGTYFFNDWAISVCPPSSNPYPNDSRGVIQHEACGHGFGKLGDENIQRNMFAPNSVKGYVNDMHGRRWYMNLASTGKMKDVPWAHYIFDERYSDHVDVFEGGLGYTRGIWRSESNSCMNFGIPYFNAISREYITRRVMDMARAPFSMEEFYQNDTQKWGATTFTRSSSETLSGNLQPIANHKAPVLVKGNELRNKLRELRKNQKK